VVGLDFRAGWFPGEVRFTEVKFPNAAAFQFGKAWKMKILGDFPTMSEIWIYR